MSFCTHPFLAPLFSYTLAPFFLATTIIALEPYHLREGRKDPACTLHWLLVNLSMSLFPMENNHLAFHFLHLLVK